MCLVWGFRKDVVLEERSRTAQLLSMNWPHEELPTARPYPFRLGVLLVRLLAIRGLWRDIDPGLSWEPDRQGHPALRELSSV